MENLTDEWPFGPPLDYDEIKSESGKQLLDADTRETLELVISFVTLLVSVMGVVTNAINVRVFVKQGVASDSTTIGFFSLALADLLACLVSLPQSLCFVYKMTDRLAMFTNCHAATLMSSQYPRIVFSRISCWINVYIAVERCLCVMIPLKVKLLIRPRMTACAMMSIYVFFGFFHLPLGVNTFLSWKFNAGLNQSVLVVDETPLGQKALFYQSLIGTTILASLALVIVAISTGLLLYKLKISSKFSASLSSGGNDSGNADNKKQPRKRDLEVMKTVSAVTGLFLACLTIGHIPALASLAIPGFNVTGTNKNLVFLLYNIRFLFDTINSSSNFFFYIRISSRYQAAFNAVFRRESDKK